ncbi:hypothetical protein B0H67DRAFT_639740 [Lasiosphaeris hirsuta]|uniref:Uncharacterized protein n=1 Tax=Lasiosphaeris hirsuta TaxID=260670 RepID=A0AA40BCA8_9PEZI|nr:hypothetical protein B0H67DRAFT_639740 [Lasiosphaeris hirsuta]
MVAVWFYENPDGNDRGPTLFATAITSLYAECLRVARFPAAWKIAEVVPIPKVGRSRATKWHWWDGAPEDYKFWEIR